MSDRYFLDTNIFVYACDRTDSGKARRAETLILEALQTRKGVISYQVAQEFLNLALRRFARPMTTSEAAQYFHAVLQPLLTIHSSGVLLEEALRVCERYRLSWYDALIVTAAIEADCALLYSEDFQDGQRFGTLRVRNPFP